VTHLAGVSIIIFIIAVVMTMTGRGGGNFYVLTLVLAGVSMHEAATTGQFILMLTAVAGTLLFHKHRMVDWKLALVIDPPTDIMALVGGYYAHMVAGTTLKLILAGLLMIAGICMMLKVKYHPVTKSGTPGFWHRHYNGQDYIVNLWVTIPVTAAVGLAAGAVGISGGSFKIPLMVLFCGVPMRIAVGTSSAMVAATALMGFLGHTAGGDFNPSWALPIAGIAVVGGLLGSKIAIKTNPTYLKYIFAFTTMLAAVMMTVNAFGGKG